MSVWEQRIRMLDGKIASYKKGRKARYYKLVAERTTHNILKEITLKVMGYNGTTPGPLLVFKQGEMVLIEVENRLDEPTALHVHGLSKPNTQDGMTEIEPTPIIKPGGSYTYRFNAWQSGTFFYHASNPFHISQGLIGPFVVLPKESGGSPIYPPDRDYVLLLQQWEVEQKEMGKVTPGTYKPKKFDVNPNFFTINGKSFPETSILNTKFGERLRLRFINKSNAAHSVHTHGHDFQVVEVNGFPRYNLMDDTINVASGQRWSVEFMANNPGIWPINGTKTFHQSNNGKAPGGMITRLKYIT